MRRKQRGGGEDFKRQLPGRVEDFSSIKYIFNSISRIFLNPVRCLEFMFLGVIRFISPENELPEPPSGPTEYFYTDIYDFSSRRTDESKDFDIYEDLTNDLHTSYHSYDAVPQQDKGKNRFLRI